MFKRIHKHVEAACQAPKSQQDETTNPWTTEMFMNFHNSSWIQIIHEMHFHLLNIQQLIGHMALEFCISKHGVGQLIRVKSRNTF